MCKWLIYWVLIFPLLLINLGLTGCSQVAVQEEDSPSQVKESAVTGEGKDVVKSTGINTGEATVKTEDDNSSSEKTKVTSVDSEVVVKTENESSSSSGKSEVASTDSSEVKVKTEVKTSSSLEKIEVNPVEKEQGSSGKLPVVEKPFMVTDSPIDDREENSLEIQKAKVLQEFGNRRENTPEELFQLAQEYQEVKKNYALALEYYQKAAELGYAEAQNSLGMMYHQGIGVQQNLGSAEQWFRKAAEQDLSEAQYNLGQMYYSGRGIALDVEQAKRWFKRAAEQKDGLSQLRLGEVSYDEREYVMAKYWFSQAAQQNLPEAQKWLGVLFYQGQGVPQDYYEAFRWFEKSAEQGSAEAQNNLALMYFKGEGVKQNYILSYQWASLSALKEHPEALKAREFFASRLTPSQIAEGERLAREWLAKRVESVSVN